MAREWRRPRAAAQAIAAAEAAARQKQCEGACVCLTKRVCVALCARLRETIAMAFECGGVPFRGQEEALAHARIELVERWRSCL